MSDAVAVTALVPVDARRKAADRVFQGALAYTSALTLLWLYFVVTQRAGGALFPHYDFDRQTLVRVGSFFLFFSIFWGWIWYLIRRFLLRRLGLSAEELRLTFSSRMDEPFDLGAFLARYPERRIRIIDMIGRRGRFATMAMTGFAFIYAQLAAAPQPGFLTVILGDNLSDAVLLSWVSLALYYSNGWLARMFWGAQSRLMDGSLARANCLLITTLWSAFKFVMVPIGMKLQAHFGPQAYAPLFILIWGSYVTGDAFAEIVGALIGKQRLRVWGLGDVNRKSVAGTWACFLGSLALCLWVVAAHGLPLPWLGLALAISLSNTFFELFSPRGTDDFTMATASALICWGFGVLVY